MTEETIRIDKFLWYARLAKTRTAAQRFVEMGSIRIDRKRPSSAHSLVRVGQIITTFARGEALVIRVEHIPKRRGPISEAESCYSRVATEDAIDANGTLA